MTIHWYSTKFIMNLINFVQFILYKKFTLIYFVFIHLLIIWSVKTSKSNLLKAVINEQLRVTYKKNSINHKMVTDESTEQQLIASLKYYKTRHLYIQKALNRLYILTKSFQETRIDLLLLIIELMLFHNKSQSVQLLHFQSYLAKIESNYSELYNNTNN